MSIDEAVAELERGALVAFPTETVYGLGADASNPDAIAALYAAKGRPADHPVIVHLGSIEQLDSVAIDVPQWARRLALACWPGPLTLVVHRRPVAVCDAVSGGAPTVAVRVPNHPVALDLLKRFGRGVAAPSANRFGKVSPTTAAHVQADFDDEIAIVLDGGPCTVGVESTIVDASTDEPRILRVGGISTERIEALIGRPVVVRNGGEIATNLLSLYTFVLNELVEGNVTDKAEHIDNAFRTMSELRESWVELERTPKTGAEVTSHAA